MEPTLAGLPGYEEEFQVRDDTDRVFKTKWQWAPSMPTRNQNGVSGWALSVGRVIRLHVCAHVPCTARRAMCTERSRHVRLIGPCKPGPVHSQVPVHSHVPSKQVVLLAPAAGSEACIVWCGGSLSPTWLCIRRLWLYRLWMLLESACLLKILIHGGGAYGDRISRLF